MADDSDVDSWNYLKQDEFIKIPIKTSPSQSSGSKFCGSHLPCSPRNGIKLSNGYSVLDCYKTNKKFQPQSSPEVRFINPAIYAESLAPSNDDEYPVPTSTDEGASIVVEVRVGDSNNLAEELSALSVNEETPRSGGAGDVRNKSDQPAAETYRCYESDTSRTSTLTFTNNSKSVTRLIRRCAINESSKNYDNDDGDQEDVRRFTLNGRRIVQCSSTSLSSSAFSENRTSGLTLARKIAHEEWIQKKQRAAKQISEMKRREELNRREEEERIDKERREREQRERENFLKWQERKNKEETDRRLAVERELELQKRLKDVEDNAAIVKIIHLQQWARKKEEEQKAQQKEQELKRKAIEEERKKRLEESSHAFEKWRESAKSRPKPATQGLLPHQRAKPSFVNPNPWKQIVDDEPIEDGQKTLLNKKVVGQSKNNVRKTIASHH